MTLPPPIPPSPSKPGFFRLRPYSVQDDPSVGIGGEVARMLLPGDWQVQAQMIWRHDMIHLASLHLAAWDPHTGDQFTIFPTHGFTWMDGGYPFFGQGSIYMGNEVCPPIGDGVQFLHQIIVPRFRGQAAGPRWAGHEEFPTVAQAAVQALAEPGVQKFGKAGRARLQYQLQGRPLEEDFRYILVYAPMMIPGMPAMTLWGPHSVSSILGVSGRVDRLAGLHQAILSSIRLNPRWIVAHKQVQQMFINNANASIRRAGQLSRYISQVNDEIMEMNRASWEARQASEDRISHQFSQCIRGVESYADPSDPGRAVELPSGYQQAWTNGLGEYIVADTYNFDPNQQLNGNWTKMNKL